MKKNNKVFWCNNCLNMSTRPRIGFDANGNCNACMWSDEKKVLDWSTREQKLYEVIKEHRNPDSDFDCIVPVSGGKDGSYVAHTLKNKYNLNVLTVTVRPPLSLSLGDRNLENFIHSGFDHIHISPNAKIMQLMNKHGFIEKGFPYYGWLIAIKTAVIQAASNYGINIIFYGEDGEVEYGGSMETKDIPFYNTEYIKRVYFEDGYDKVINKVQLAHNNVDSDFSFWRFPSNEDIAKNKIIFTHWSFYENWDSYRNYIVAKEHCGLEENNNPNGGTFTNFAQNDQALYSLHAYLMYLKLGFGRATQDAGIEIRRGAMDRNQALNLVKLYDNNYPQEYLELYLDYYKMTKEEFDLVIDHHANKELFSKEGDRWMPKFNIGEEFYI